MSLLTVKYEEDDLVKEADFAKSKSKERTSERKSFFIKKKKVWKKKHIANYRFLVAYFIKSKILYSHMTVQILCGLLRKRLSEKIQIWIPINLFYLPHARKKKKKSQYVAVFNKLNSIMPRSRYMFYFIPLKPEQK